MGTNVVVGNSPDTILAAANTILQDIEAPGKIPEKWDGHAAERIVEYLLTIQ